ncbi:MAG: hypothetical protein ACRD3P_15575 [Terriglobales bacterium]
MKRALEVASGIAVPLVSLQTFAALIIAYQRGFGTMLITSRFAFVCCGLELLLCFAGAYILLSWANKRR